jgi:hypothetical protein
VAGAVVQHLNERFSAVIGAIPLYLFAPAAAWLGLTPLQNSSGGKERRGRITKMGGAYLRRLLAIGATALVWHLGAGPTPHSASLLVWQPSARFSLHDASRPALQICLTPHPVTHEEQSAQIVTVYLCNLA